MFRLSALPGQALREGFTWGRAFRGQLSENVTFWSKILLKSPLHSYTMKGGGNAGSRRRKEVTSKQSGTSSTQV
jgi:hypothetical protein